jgi:hypothetical protein
MFRREDFALLQLLIQSGEELPATTAEAVPPRKRGQVLRALENLIEKLNGMCRDLRAAGGGRRAKRERAAGGARPSP